MKNKQKIFPRLGVNLDHVATLRQARKTEYPSLKDAASLVLDAGAAQITIHLREDLRHIQPFDLPVIRAITQKKKKLFNLEIAATNFSYEFIKKNKPDWICLVPEKRQELTTEGGLNIEKKASLKRLVDFSESIKNDVPSLKISWFVAPQSLLGNALVNKQALKNIDAFEFHTGHWANLLETKNIQKIKKEEQMFMNAILFAKKINIGLHAGHGITKTNIKKLVQIAPFQEYNIGHSLISDALFEGIEKTVAYYINLFKKVNL